MAWQKFEYAETETVMPAKIMVVDELAQFLEGLDRKEMRKGDKFQENIQSIARLGRSAHVHCVLATQSASGNLFPSSLKNNISQRLICGRVESNISRLAIDSEEGESIPLTLGSYLGYSKGETQQFQGYYTERKEVLSLGTVKPGFDPNTGKEIVKEEDEDDFIEEIVEDPNADSSSDSGTDNNTAEMNRNNHNNGLSERRSKAAASDFDPDAFFSTLNAETDAREAAEKNSSIDIGNVNSMLFDSNDNNDDEDTGGNFDAFSSGIDIDSLIDESNASGHKEFFTDDSNLADAVDEANKTIDSLPGIPVLKPSRKNNDEDIPRNRHRNNNSRDMDSDRERPVVRRKNKLRRDRDEESDTRRNEFTEDDLIDDSETTPKKKKLTLNANSKSSSGKKTLKINKSTTSTKKTPAKKNGKSPSGGNRKSSHTPIC